MLSFWLIFLPIDLSESLFLGKIFWKPFTTPFPIISRSNNAINIVTSPPFQVSTVGLVSNTIPAFPNGVTQPLPGDLTSTIINLIPVLNVRQAQSNQLNSTNGLYQLNKLSKVKNVAVGNIIKNYKNRKY